MADTQTIDVNATNASLAQSMAQSSAATKSALDYLPQAQQQITDATTREQQAIDASIPQTQDAFKQVLQAKQNVVDHAGNPFSEVLGYLSYIPGLEKLDVYSMPKQQAIADKGVTQLSAIAQNNEAIKDSTRSIIQGVDQRVKLTLDNASIIGQNLSNITAGVAADKATGQYALDQATPAQIAQMAKTGNYNLLGFPVSAQDVKDRLAHNQMSDMALENARLNLDTAKITKDATAQEAASKSLDLALSHMNPTLLQQLTVQAADAEKKGKPFTIGNGVPVSSQQLAVAAGNASEARTKAETQSANYQTRLQDAASTIDSGTTMLTRLAANFNNGQGTAGQAMVNGDFNSINMNEIDPALRGPFLAYKQAHLALSTPGVSDEAKFTATQEAAKQKKIIDDTLEGYVKDAPAPVQDATRAWVQGRPLTTTQQDTLLLQDIQSPQINDVGNVMLNGVHVGLQGPLLAELAKGDKTLNIDPSNPHAASDMLAAMLSGKIKEPAGGALISKVLAQPSDMMVGGKPVSVREKIAFNANNAAMQQYMSLVLRKLAKSGAMGFDQIMDPATGVSTLGGVNDLTVGNVFRKITEVERQLIQEKKLPANYSMSKALINESRNVDNMNMFSQQAISPRTMYSDTLMKRVLGPNFERSVFNNIADWNNRWSQYIKQPGANPADVPHGFGNTSNITGFN